MSECLIYYFFFKFWRMAEQKSLVLEKKSLTLEEKIKKTKDKLEFLEKKQKADLTKFESNSILEESKNVTLGIGNGKTIQSWKFLLERIYNLQFKDVVNIEKEIQNIYLSMVHEVCEFGSISNEYGLEYCRLFLKNPKIKTAKDYVPNQMIISFRYYPGIVENFDISNIKFPYEDFKDYFPHSVSRILPSNSIPEFFYLTIEDQGKILQALNCKDPYTNICAKVFTEKDDKYLISSANIDEKFTFTSILEFLGSEHEQKTKEMDNFQKDFSFKLLIVYLESHVTEVLKRINNNDQKYFVINEHGKREREEN
jgi:hypothetical protein